MSKPNIFIFGPSATGKSTSLRNLDPAKTAILNTEQKALPFKEAGKFKNVDIKTSLNFYKVLEKAMSNPEIKVIVIESFTGLCELVFRELNTVYSGFDLWGEFKKEVGKFLNLCKNTSKYIVFTGIDAVISGASGVEERYIAIDGAWKKLVEKEFVIVLYSNFVIDESGNPKHRFITNKQKGFEHVSCKSPMEMLPSTMDNDLKQVIDLIDKYYGFEEKPLTLKQPETQPVVENPPQ